MKQTIKRLLRKTQYKVQCLALRHLFKEVPGGIDLFYDTKNYLPRFDNKIIFDVGANCGQSTVDYLQHYSRSKIYCFEPVFSTYCILKKRLELNSNVHCYNFALGAQQSQATMQLEGNSSTFKIVADCVSTKIGTDSEVVKIETLDDFCINNRITEINMLKIDTEGHDLLVLKGAERLLNRMHIDMIQVEAGMHCGNSLHVPFHKFTEFLEPKGYYLFKIYEQSPEALTSEATLRRTNPVYISRRIIEMNRLPMH